MPDKRPTITSNQGKPLSDIFFERLWDSYALTDNRRVKSFYYLFTTMAAFLILWITKEQSFELPILKTKVNMFVAFSLFPAFVMILSSRYLFLCAHTIETITSALRYINDTYKEELEKQGCSLHEMYVLFKQRDLTENLNIYFFPIRWAVKKKTMSKTKYLLKSVVYSITNMAIIFTIIAPIVSYWTVMFWLKANFPAYVSGMVGYTMLAFYAVLGLLFILVPIYFYYRVESTRKFVKTHIYGWSWDVGRE